MVLVDHQNRLAYLASRHLPGRDPLRVREAARVRAGLGPSALFHIIGNTDFLDLSNLASCLPGFDEQILISSIVSSGESHFNRAQL